MSKNWPVYRITIFTATPLLLVMWLQLFYFRISFTIDSYAAIWFFIGVVYVHLFEYFHHRGPMHYVLRVPFPRCGWLNDILSLIRMSHRTHHKIFRGKRFQSDDKDHLNQITSPGQFFPVAFLVHYFIFLVFLSPNSLTFFAIAVVIRYLSYEIPHFFTHKKDNKIDQFLFKIPVLGYLRRKQIHYHRRHHDNVKINFSVTPPYLDPLFGTISTKNPA